MKRFALILAALAAPALAGCVSSGGSGGGVTESGYFRSSRTSDTLGTQRRMDVYGGATAPVLPTMGAVGYGK